MSFRVYNTGLWYQANAFQTTDASSSPQSSPLSLDGTSTYTLTVPTNAVQLKLFPTVDLDVSEDSSMSNYFQIAANSVVTIPVADVDKVYVKSGSSGSLYFMFELV